MTKFHAEFPNFMQNYWKRVNSEKYRIVIASKTVAGQYGSSTVLQQVNVQQCNWTDTWGVVPKLRVLGV